MVARLTADHLIEHTHSTTAAHGRPSLHFRLVRGGLPGARPRRPHAPHLSLLTPTGHLTLGNLLGALRPMARRQDDADCFYGISDLHALTAAARPGAAARARPRETATLLLAAGLDRATLFVQSQVPAHAELAYLLECTAYTGELNRMIQFKEKGRGVDSTRVSLFTYPALMAADILLYRPEQVPVGDDQRQHVELTRDLALRFNRDLRRRCSPSRRSPRRRPARG